MGLTDLKKEDWPKAVDDFTIVVENLRAENDQLAAMKMLCFNGRAQALNIVVTIMYGIGISGVDSLGRFLYAREPNIIKTIIIRKTDDFHFIATFVISIGYSPRRIGEPSDKNC